MKKTTGKGEKVTIIVPVPLDEHTKADIADQILELRLKIEEEEEKISNLQEEHKRELSELKDNIKDQDEVFKELIKCLKKGAIDKEMPVLKYKNYDENKFEYFQGKEMVHSEPMNDTDRQRSIDEEFGEELEGNLTVTE